jgi:hypothetical protein
MNAFEKFLHILQVEMETPQTLGVWHLCSFALMIALCVLAAWRLRDASDKTVRRILFVAWLLLFLTEAYKQLVFTLHVNDGVASWSYAWYAFPFQFCSSPLYVLPLAALLPNGRLRDAVLAFLATFSFFAGLAVMVYPGDVFIGMIGINIQTMLHHGSQVAIGALLVAHNRRRYTRGFVLRGIPVFLAMACIALIADIAAYHILLANSSDHVFNMFYISPYFISELPVFNTIQEAVPYPLFLASYVVGLMLGSVVIMGIALAIQRFVKYVNNGWKTPVHN